jgi:hypothetical protein
MPRVRLYDTVILKKPCNSYLTPEFIYKNCNCLQNHLKEFKLLTHMSIHEAAVTKSIMMLLVLCSMSLFCKYCWCCRYLSWYLYPYLTSEGKTKSLHVRLILTVRRSLQRHQMARMDVKKSYHLCTWIKQKIISDMDPKNSIQVHFVLCSYLFQICLRNLNLGINPLWTGWEILFLRYRRRSPHGKA